MGGGTDSDRPPSASLSLDLDQVRARAVGTDSTADPTPMPDVGAPGAGLGSGMRGSGGSGRVGEWELLPAPGEGSEPMDLGEPRAFSLSLFKSIICIFSCRSFASAAPQYDAVCFAPHPARTGLTQYQLLEATQRLPSGPGARPPALGGSVTGTTLTVASLVARRLAEAGGGAGAQVPMRALSAPLSRTEAARLFYQLLVCEGAGLLALRQGGAYGEIAMRRGRHLGAVEGQRAGTV